MDDRARLPPKDPETLSPPDALSALGVHFPAGHLPEAGDALVAGASGSEREVDHCSAFGRRGH
jgi:hypothetical protein